MDDVRAELDAVFENHEAKKREAEAAQIKRADEAGAFVERFHQLQKATIYPVMESIGAYIVEKGYRFKITQQEDRMNSNGGLFPAQVMFTVYDADGYGDPEKWPHVMFQCDKKGKKVIAFESTMSPNHGGHGGSTGNTDIDAVTEDYVKQKLVALIKQLFK